MPMACDRGCPAWIFPNADAAYYTGKIHAAEFFVNNILTLGQGKATTILSGNKSALQIPEAAF